MAGTKNFFIKKLSSYIIPNNIFKHGTAIFVFQFDQTGIKIQIDFRI
jgi:hypothetical protein